MANYKIGSPLFIVRELCERDLPGVLEKIAEIGFEGVELVGLFGYSVKEIRQKLDSLSMVAISDHVDVNTFSMHTGRVLDEHKELGCKYITLAWPDKSIRYGTPGFDEIINKIKSLCEVCYENGFTPIYHNHNFEFSSEPSWIHILMDACEKERLCLEPDLGWMAYSSAEQTAYLTKYRDRTPIIHLKDIYARDFSKIGPGVEHGGMRNNPETGCFEFRPTGYGVVNFPMLMPYCIDCKPEWFIADHDLAYGRDSFEDLKLSYDYILKLLEICG